MAKYPEHGEVSFDADSDRGNSQSAMPVSMLGFKTNAIVPFWLTMFKKVNFFPGQEVKLALEIAAPRTIEGAKGAAAPTRVQSRPNIVSLSRY